MRPWMLLLAGFFALMGLNVLGTAAGWWSEPRWWWGAFWLFGLAAFFAVLAIRPAGWCGGRGAGRWPWVPEEPPRQG